MSCSYNPGPATTPRMRVVGSKSARQPGDGSRGPAPTGERGVRGKVLARLTDARRFFDEAHLAAELVRRGSGRGHRLLHQEARLRAGRGRAVRRATLGDVAPAG